MDDDSFEKGLKENRRYAFIFLGIFCVISIIIFYFSLSGAILNHDNTAIAGAWIFGFLIVLIIGFFAFCLYKEKRKKRLRNEKLKK